MKNKLNIDQGIKFECQGSSNCCVSRGSYGYVYLSKKDVKKLAYYKNLNIDKFINLYCEKDDGLIRFKEKEINGNCQFLKNKKCNVYEARPTQCRTWPFWSENMNAKKWNKDIAKFCPGIGKGKIIKKDTINKFIKEDNLNEKKMLEEIQ